MASDQEETRVSEQRTIRLEPEDFWCLRALIRDAEAIELELKHAHAILTLRHRDACERRDAVLHRIAAKYGLADPGTYRTDDANCSLIFD